MNAYTSAAQVTLHNIHIYLRLHIKDQLVNGLWSIVIPFHFFIRVNTVYALAMGAANNFLSRKSTRINTEKTWQRNIWPNLRNITINCRENYVDVS